MDIDQLLLHSLATTLGGTFAASIDGGIDSVRVDGAVIYVGLDRLVKVQRHGYPVAAIGNDTDTVGSLVAGYRDLVLGVGA